jgi:molybdopterin/thiamine biosynthesis adenylyltransferase
MFDTLVTEENNTETENKNMPTIYNDEVRDYVRSTVRNRVLELKEDANLNLNHMGIRFSDIVNRRFMDTKSVAIIGAGNLGHPTFRTICNLGFKAIAVIDDDTIDIENISPQDHDLVEIGQPKVKFLEAWALRHCGLQVDAIQERVEDMDHLYDLLDFTPDIVIVCVDNMKLRNAILQPIAYDDEEACTPELLIDMRMAAGQWTTFILPLEAVTYIFDRFGPIQDLVTKHMIFSDEEGVQEACTARATNFTGYNAASYVGAFLTWYSNNHASFNTSEYLLSFLNVKTEEGPSFKWEHSFNCMQWRTITKTPQEYKQLAISMQFLKRELELDMGMHRAYVINTILAEPTFVNSKVKVEYVQTSYLEGNEVHLGDLLVYSWYNANLDRREFSLLRVLSSDNLGVEGKNVFTTETNYYDRYDIRVKAILRNHPRLVDEEWDVEEAPATASPTVTSKGEIVLENGTSYAVYITDEINTYIKASDSDEISKVVAYINSVRIKVNFNGHEVVIPSKYINSVMYMDNGGNEVFEENFAYERTQSDEEYSVDEEDYTI